MRDASNNRIQCLVLDHQCVFGISCQNGRGKMVKQQIKQKAPATCMYTYAPQHVLSVVHLFGSWLQGFTWDSKKIIFTGLCALLWSIWLSRNDVVFHNTQRQTILHILFRAIHLTRTWAILQKEENRAWLHMHTALWKWRRCTSLRGTSGNLAIGFVACNLLYVYSS